MGHQPPPGYPPPPHGYPPQQQGYGPPPQGYPPQWPPPPPKKGLPAWAIILMCMGGLVVACGVLAAIGKNASTSSTGSGPVSGQAPSRPSAKTVQIKEILSAYKGNELRADGQYKDQVVEIQGGKVDDVKKDILDSPYITIGTGAAFEIPQIQCMLESNQASKAANLNKGEKITVRGQVSGLMMNVLVRDCEIL